MPSSILESIKIKAKLLQKAKKKAGKEIKLSEAFEILARTAGFPSWREWREVLVDHDALIAPQASAHWHVWYSSYEKACSELSKHSGFLLPYQKHFFICDMDYMKSLGIKEDDPDLALVGNNWCEPLDIQAYHRLRKKILGQRED